MRGWRGKEAGEWRRRGGDGRSGDGRWGGGGRGGGGTTVTSSGRIQLLALSEADANAQARGLSVGASLVEEDKLDLAKKLEEMAKAKGVQLGKHGRDVLSALNRQNADHFAERMQPVIAGLRKKGITTVRAIAQELNRRAVPTFTSAGRWHPTTVQNIIRRMNQCHSK